MYYHYHPETKEFICESNEKIKDFPATEIDINFNLSDYKSQIFKDDKWIIVHDYRKANIYKKNSVIKVFKKLGEKLNEDEIIYPDEDYIPPYTREKTEEEKKYELKLEINSYLAKTDKYFNNHPPKYKGNFEKLKDYRNYLYEFTEKENWWLVEIISFEKWK
jgi:hypothetical protein